MGSKSSAPPPPNYKPIAEASKYSADLAYKQAQEQMAWAREQFDYNKGITDEVVDSVLKVMDNNYETALKDRARYENTFQPLEDQLAQDAQDFSSPERKEYEAGKAQAGVAEQYNLAREAAQRNLEGYGIDPSAVRYQALDLGARVKQGADMAAAANTARDRVDATGRALRSEAINVGRGYPGQIAGQYATAMNAGNQGVNSNLATTASGASTMGTAPQYMGLGNQALGVWGNTLNMGYQNQLAQYNANQQSSSGLGSALGLIGGLAGRAFFMEDGGPVDEGMSPTGGEETDDVPARLNVGEFVLPREAVEWYGEKHLLKMIEKAKQERGEMQKRTQAVPDYRPAPAQEPTFVSGAQRALPVG